jgi:uncharacterized protein
VLFFVILGLVIFGNAVWWTWADRKLRRLRGAHWWRFALALFNTFELSYLLFMLILPAQGRHAHAWLPAVVLALIYIWNLFVLPGTFFAILIIEGVRALARWRRRRVSSATASQSSGLTRRELLAAAAVTVPPLVLAGSVGYAMEQLGHFRTRRFQIPLANLPRELDGLTIAHVSDLHIGRFLRPRMLPGIITAVNELKTDLVVFTGDLIDLSLTDLQTGIDTMRKIDPRNGMFMVEGNHDLIEGPFDFEMGLRAAKLPLLLNESAIATVRGVPIQFLGTVWARGEERIRSVVDQVLPLRQSELFTILLAHHPHAFDPAADANIPLTLSGHTHGGQLMLNERLGAGPAMFRYWSGLYREHDSALVVSNGVGNWFPLRIGAPAELVHITLRCQT